MVETAALLDTSALFTFIEDEPGADRVEALLRRPDTLITWVSVLEVYYITLQERGEVEAAARHNLIKALPVTFLQGMEEHVLIEAARIKANYKVSFADAIIAACAICADATLVHKDPEFAPLAGKLKLEALPSK